MHAAPVVTTLNELHRALAELRPAAFVAIDTEFMRESTYYPKLCLLQLGTADACVLVDPLAIDDLQPLWEFLGERHRVKVLHAARQDVEVLSLSIRAPVLPGPIFDTQIAGALLGMPAQIGYGSMVAERLGRSLEKGHARTDWTRRPLRHEQLEYAADDVRYLVPLYDDLRTALDAAGRLPWLYEETREFESPALHRTEPQDAWRRLKGLDQLQPAQRATAKLLAQWREKMAIEHDKPRGWILTDESLREIAERLPVRIESLERIQTVPPAVIRKRGEDLLALVAQGKLDAASEPEAFTPPRPDPAKLARVTKLMKFARGYAEQLKISPEILATRRDIEQIVFAGRAERLMLGWRREVIGEPLMREAGLPST